MWPSESRRRLVHRTWIRLDSERHNQNTRANGSTKIPRTLTRKSKVKQAPTMAFTPEHVADILKACDEYAKEVPRQEISSARRTRTQFQKRASMWRPTRCCPGRNGGRSSMNTTVGQTCGFHCARVLRVIDMGTGRETYTRKHEALNVRNKSHRLVERVGFEPTRSPLRLPAPRVMSVLQRSSHRTLSSRPSNCGPLRASPTILGRGTPREDELRRRSTPCSWSST